MDWLIEVSVGFAIACTGGIVGGVALVALASWLDRNDASRAAAAWKEHRRVHNEEEGEANDSYDGHETRLSDVEGRLRREVEEHKTWRAAIADLARLFAESSDSRVHVKRKDFPALAKLLLAELPPCDRVVLVPLAAKEGEDDDRAEDRDSD